MFTICSYLARKLYIFHSDNRLIEIIVIWEHRNIMKFKNLFLSSLLLTNLLIPLVTVSAEGQSSTPPKIQNKPTAQDNDSNHLNNVKLPEQSATSPLGTTEKSPIEVMDDVVKTGASHSKASPVLRATSSGTHGTVSWQFDDTTGLLTFSSAGTLENGTPLTTNLANHNVNPDLVKKIVFTAKVELPTYSGGMFAQLSNLTEFDAKNLDSQNATTLEKLFCDDLKLKQISNISFKSNVTVTSMAGMFRGCTALQTLDISSMLINSNVAVHEMFTNTPSLWKIKFGTSIRLNDNCGLQEAPAIGTKLITDDGKLYTTRSNSWRIIDAGTEHNPTGSKITTAQMRTISPDLGRPVEVVWDNDTNYNGVHGSVQWQLNPTTKQLVFGVSGNGTFESALSVKNNLQSYQVDPSLVKDISFNSNQISTLAANSSGLFADLTDLRTFSDKGLNANLATNLRYLFANDSMLKDISFKGFDASNAITLEAMFQNCSSLTFFDGSSFNISTINNMKNMFEGCANLEKLDLSNWRTTYNANHYNMFAGTTNLWQLTLAKGADYNNDWGLPQVPKVNTTITDGGSSYYVRESKWQAIGTGSEHNPTGKTYATPADLADDTPTINATSNQTFVRSNDAYMHGVHGISPWTLNPNNGALTFSTGKFQDNLSVKDNLTDYDVTPESVRSINFTGTVILRPNSSSLFGGLDKLYSFDGENLDSHDVTDWSNFFMADSVLTDFKKGTLDTRNATDMSAMFALCTSLDALDLSFLDTTNVTDMSHMFEGATNITSLDFSTAAKLKTANLTSMESMFCDMNSLVSLDLSLFDTFRVTKMGKMFAHASELRDINLSSFSTKNVTDMRYMFADCSQLRTLDLSKFDTTNTNGTHSMFLNTNSLWQIKLGVDTQFSANPEFCNAPAANTTIPGTSFKTSAPYWQFVGTGSVNHPLGNTLLTTSLLWAENKSERTFVWAQHPDTRVNSIDTLTFSDVNLNQLASFTPSLSNNPSDGIELGFLYGVYDISVTQSSPWTNESKSIPAKDLPITYGGQNLSNGNQVSFANGTSTADSLKIKFNHDSSKKFAIDLATNSNLTNAKGQNLTTSITWTINATP